MSKFQVLLDQARQLFNQHNYLRTLNRIDVDDFQVRLQQIGGTSVERLQLCSEEDLISCGLPRIIARQTVELFQGHLPTQTLETGRDFVPETQKEQEV